MATEIDRINPAVGFVRALNDDWFICNEVADALGTSASTLRRLARVDPVELSPSHVAAFGGIDIWLYDMPLVQRISDHLANQRSTETARRGRPRLWTEQERRDRRVSLSLASYRRRRARALRLRADVATAVIAEQAAKDITAGLRLALLDRTRLVARAGHADALWPVE